MKRIMFELTEELGAAIDAALGNRERNPTLEAWLWRVREIREAAQRLGVRKPVRRGRGRPRGEVSVITDSTGHRVADPSASAAYDPPDDHLPRDVYATELLLTVLPAGTLARVWDGKEWHWQDTFYDGTPVAGTVINEGEADEWDSVLLRLPAGLFCLLAVSASAAGVWGHSTL